jgi:parvulin-like peptidyl-prolyl isomerase
MKKVVVFILAIPLLFAFIACAKKEEAKREEAKGPYLAIVGNTKITEADLDREMKTLPEFAQKLFVGGEGKGKFLNELIKKELLYQEAMKKGLDKDPEYQKKVEDFKKLTLIGLLLEKEVESKTKVTDQDVKNYYEKHKSELSPITAIRISHILVKSEAEAKNIYDSLEKGADFAKIAREKSIDKGTAKNGGDLGYMSKGQMLPEIEATASRMKIGEISEPIKTKSGYEIIKVTNEKFGKPMEFERVKNVLFQRLSAEKQKEVFDAYVENLKKSYKVEINTEAVSKLAAEEEKNQGTQVKPGQTGEPREQKQGTKTEKSKKD